jgi:hypothetical protein
VGLRRRSHREQAPSGDATVIRASTPVQATGASGLSPATLPLHNVPMCEGAVLIKALGNTRAIHPAEMASAVNRTMIPYQQLFFNSSARDEDDNNNSDCDSFTPGACAL